MGIEPTRAPLPELQNKRFSGIANAKCDWRVNFHDMWGHARLRMKDAYTVGHALLSSAGRRRCSIARTSANACSCGTTRSFLSSANRRYWLIAMSCEEFSCGNAGA